RHSGGVGKVVGGAEGPGRRLLGPGGSVRALSGPLVPVTAYASHTAVPGTPGALKGVRIGVIRESMVYPPGSLTEVPIVSAAAGEIKSVLGGTLGATPGETGHPRWTPQPGPGVNTAGFRRAP